MSCDYRILDLVPHDEPMSLLDEVLESWPGGLLAGVTITEQSLFAEARGVPAWVGIEYMGQAIAAWAGLEARKSNRPVKIGFLVSTRRYDSPASYFPLGACLQVSVEQITESVSGLQVFDCKIRWDDCEISANLNVFMPENVEEFLQGDGNG